MNDRFKVRAWDQKNKVMILFPEFRLSKLSGFEYRNPEIMMSTTQKHDHRWDLTIDDLILMQCAGLKDDEGTPIFESDILECSCPEGTIVAVVEYGNPNSAYWWGLQLRKLKGDDFNMDILLWVETELPHMECRIIGNRYSNPELMEGNNG